MALGGAFCAAAAALPAGAGTTPEQSLHVAATGLGAERIKTVPISRRSGAKKRVAMSLPPRKVGPIRAGDSVWAGGEVEVSVTCLEPMPKCVGRIYRFSPHVKAQLVLATGPRATRAKNTAPISGASRLRCSQELPHRNHHCGLALDGTRPVGDRSKVPCDRCYVNLVLDAYHDKARRGNVIVVGSDSDRGIAQDKGTLNAGVFAPGPPSRLEPLVTTKPSTRRIPVATQGGSGGERRVVLSRRVNELRAGEQLMVDLRIRVGTRHLGYGALLQSQLVLSEKAGSIKRSGVSARIDAQHGVITAQNGFNCTRGKSGHTSPCLVRKLGVVRVSRDARAKPLRGEGPFVPLFVNLVMQSKAEYGGHRHRRGDVAKVARSGSLAVTRYGPEYRP